MLESNLHALRCVHSCSCSTHLKAERQNFLFKKSYLLSPPDLLQNSGQPADNGQWLRSVCHTWRKGCKLHPLSSVLLASFPITRWDFVSLEFLPHYAWPMLASRPKQHWAEEQARRHTCYHREASFPSEVEIKIRNVTEETGGAPRQVGLMKLQLNTVRKDYISRRYIPFNINSKLILPSLILMPKCKAHP